MRQVNYGSGFHRPPSRASNRGRGVAASVSVGPEDHEPVIVLLVALVQDVGGPAMGGVQIAKQRGERAAVDDRRRPPVPSCAVEVGQVEVVAKGVELGATRSSVGSASSHMPSAN